MFKKTLIYCLIILAFALLFANSTEVKLEEELEQKTIPTYTSGARIKAPKKALRSARGAKGTDVMDVYRCSEDNNSDCRDKLKELKLFYCWCYEDGNGDIVACGYRGKRDKCKTPEFY